MPEAVADVAVAPVPVVEATPVAPTTPADNVAPEVKETPEVKQDDNKEPERPPRKDRLERRFRQFAGQVSRLQNEIAELRRGQQAPQSQGTQAEPQAQYQQPQSQQSQPQADPVANMEWSEKILDAKGVYKDFDQVIAAAVNVPSTPAMEAAIRSSDIGAEVLYHLCKNPETAADLYHMDPVSVAREIGRLEAKLEIEKSKVRPVAVSKAPAPIVPIAGNGAGAPIDLDKCDTATYMKLRREQTKNKRK